MLKYLRLTVNYNVNVKSMKEYMDKTADIHFLRSQLPTLVRELEFWETNRSVLLEKNGTTYQLFAFATGGTGEG